MKITLNIPDTTKVLTINGVFIASKGFMLAQKSLETSELYDGAEIIYDWCEVQDE